MIDARFGAGVWLHVAKAFLAAVTARSTSAAGESGVSAITSPVDGLCTGTVLADAGASHAPPM
jgi:hypothetical protein